MPVRRQSRAPRRAAAAAIVLGLPSVASVAVAADPVKVVVIHHADDEPSRRVRAELGAAGLEAVDVTARGDEQSSARVALRVGAVAAIHVVSSDEMEITIVDRDSGAILYDKVQPSSGTTGDPLALRVVEDLRGRLIRLRIVEPPSEKSAPSEVAPATAASGSPERDAGASPGSRGPSLWTTAAFGAAGSAGGLGATPAARAGLRFDSSTRWAGSIDALLPLGAATVSDATAHADVHTFVFDGRVHFRLTDPGSWGADVGAGVGAVVATMQGYADTALFTGRSETLVAGAVLADASIEFRPISGLRFRGELAAGTSVPRLAVGFDHRDVALWGRPFGVALLGAEVLLYDGGARR